MATDLETGIAELIVNTNIISDIINEDATTEVSTSNGNIPSLRKALADNIYFQDPIPWSIGVNEVNFNQLRTYTDGTVWWCPSATTSNPVLMGPSPFNDNRWFPWQDRFTRQDIIDEVDTTVTEQANRAQREADRAQAAADATLLSSTLYADVSTGLAATSNGQYFSVVSVSDINYTDLYLNNNGSAELQKSYPNAKAVDDLYISLNRVNDDRIEILQETGTITRGNAKVYADTGIPKTQSTLYSGYAVAIDMTTVNAFDQTSMHIQLDNPTPCKAYVLDSSLNVVMSTDVEGVDGWNELLFPRLVTLEEVGVVAYIGIETVNRDPMTINTLTSIPSAYANTGTYPVKGSLIANSLGNFSNTVSSQFRIPLRLWNSHELYTSYGSSLDNRTGRVNNILAGALTSGLAKLSGGVLEDSVTSFTSTVVGLACAYSTVKSFDTFRVYFNAESASNWRVYLKDDQLNTIESLETGTLSAGKNFATIPLSRVYTSTELGNQFYVAIESVGHVSRVSTQNFVDDESVFPQPPNSYPVKSTVAANAEDTGWAGGGSSIAYRIYTEFFDLEDAAEILKTSLDTASGKEDMLAIPSVVNIVDGIGQTFYKGNMTSEIDISFRLFGAEGGINPSGGGAVAKDRNTHYEININNGQTLPVEFSLHSRERVPLDNRTVTFNKVASTSGNGNSVKALCIGDSITARGFWTQDLLDLEASDGLNVSLLGTQGTAPNLHEGYGGETVDWFYTDAASPFVFSGSFNFAQYLSTNTIDDPDYVCIHLGVNDIGDAVNDTAATTITENASVQLEDMISQFKAANADVKVFIMLPITSSFDVSAWDAAFGGSILNWRYNANRSKWCNTMIDNFDFRTSENIHVLPTNITIDNINSYDTSDPIHPLDDGIGYEAMAKTVFSFMKVLEA